MATYSEGTVSSNDALFTLISGQLGTNGWITHDILSDSPGNRWRIVRSPNMGGAASIYAYMGIRMVGTQINFSMYSMWDDSANAGQHEVGMGSPFDQDLTGWNYFLRVNSWALGIVLETGGVYHKGYAGLVRRGLRPERAGRTSVTAGLFGGETTIPVLEDLTSTLRPGQNVLLYNTNPDSVVGWWQNVEALTVAGVSPGTISFTTPVVNSYDFDAIIGENPLPCAVLNPGPSNSNSSILYAFSTGPLLDGGVYNSPVGQPAYAWPVLTTVPNFTTPQASDGFYGGGAWVVNQDVPNNAFYGSTYHFEVCNPGGASIANYDVLDDTVDQFRVVVDGASQGRLLFGPM